MNHAETILRALDRHLTCETSLVLYGRAALVLGFSDPPSEAAASLDVDIILPLDQAAALDDDPAFWDALDAANAELAPAGLYVTHLFAEDQVILRPEWRQHLAAIPLPGLRHLRLSRPHALDLLLTKMMRGADPQDMADARFLIRQSGLKAAEIAAAVAAARVPDVSEIRSLFAQAQAAILSPDLP